jgi:predicted  nucleic acid-binding Zn-ribbon protein
MYGIPLEYLMFGGIGFCLAWLTALMVMPAIYARAARLARQQYNDLPLSMQEIRAEKDMIRAGFAAATRDLEMKIDKLKERTVAHATDLAKKNQLVERMRQEVGALTAALRESEAREQAAREELREVRRSFADKDVTLGAAEGEKSALQRDLARKDAELQAATRDVSSLRDELAARDTALRSLHNEIASLRGQLATRDTGYAGAEKHIAAIRADLRDSEAREHDTREALEKIKRAAADKDAGFAAFEAEIAALKAERATHDAALQDRQRELEAVRAELASKETALNHAETEIAAIKAEIAALTTLLMDPDRGRDVAPPRRVEVVTFNPPPRQSAQPTALREPMQPHVVRASSPLKSPRPHDEPQIQLQREEPITAREANPAEASQSEPKPRRAPIDVIPAPSRLIPPTIPPGHQHVAPVHQQNDDSIRKAWTEISDAARRIDERPDGPNQRLRATYAPLVKNTP